MEQPIPESWMTMENRRKLMAVVRVSVGKLPEDLTQNSRQLWEAFDAGRLYQSEMIEKEE